MDPTPQDDPQKDEPPKDPGPDATDPASAADETPPVPAATKGCGLGCLGAIVLVALVLFLSNLSGNDKDTGTTYQPRAAAPAVDVDALFVKTLRDQYTFGATSDAELVDTGREVCRTLDRGVSMSQVFLATLLSDGDTSAKGFLIGVAVSAYCPEYKAKLTELANQ